MALIPGLPVSNQQQGEAHSNSRAMAIVSTLFFMWGFLTCLNDILIPHLKKIFSLNYSEAMLVQLCFFSAYFIFAMPSGKLVEWLGYRRAMVLGLVVMAAGALLFLPAAAVPSFAYFLGALIVLAAGITLLQVSANPYVSILGPESTASSRLNLAQAFNSLGTTVAPYFGSLLILHAALPANLPALTGSALQQSRLMEASSVKLPYLGIALMLLLLAGLLAWCNLPAKEYAAAKQENAQVPASDSIWRHRQLVLGAIGIFTYVGAEVAIGSFLVNYFSQPEIGNLTEKRAAMLVSLYWGGAMLGRFIGSALLQRLRTSVVLAVAAASACALVVVSMLSYGTVAVVAILLVGFFNSIMFPSIFTLGIQGLGPLTGRGSGLLVAAIVGGAVIPLLQGVLADRIGVHHAFVLPVLCYIFIAYYGLRSRRSEAHAIAVPVTVA